MDVVAPLHTRTSTQAARVRSPSTSRPLQMRTVFISDVHLGFPGCSAGFLNDFLNQVQCEYLYLVGDIVDFLYLQKKQFWCESHSDVLEKVLHMARSGTRVIYVPGNHDESIRRFKGLEFGPFEISEKTIHTTADGRKFLVLHGDQFDQAVRCSPMLALLGSRIYDVLLNGNVWLNRVRKKLGMEYWSLATFIKHRVRNAMQYIERFEEAALKAAQAEDVDAIVCGHIHRAKISARGKVTYMNCGDWVESCTALLEHPDGRMELMQWREQATSLKDLYVPETNGVEQVWAA